MKALAMMAVPAAALGVALAPERLRAEVRSRLSDDQVQAVVERTLVDRGIEGVAVAATGGTVMLTGMVPSAWSRNESEWIALKTPDVKRVTNRLTVARAGSDAALAQSVSKHVRRYVLYSVFDNVGVGVRQGNVTLTGEVTAAYKASDVALIASKVPGVRAVSNAIRTLPASLFDDRLRAAIAHRIYSDPVFESYALQVSPPIHIVVENGRVTLTGTVGSDVERVSAGFTAREVFGVMSVDNELQVAS